jgi:hypothetical protein
MNMSARLLVVFSVAAGLWAQRDPKDLLVQMSRRAVDSIDHAPRYITTETTERKYFEPHDAGRLHSCDDVAAELKSAHGKSTLGRSRLATADTVRADVAVDGGTEMYSWVGENHYTGPVDAIQFVDDRDSTQFLLDGAVTLVGVSSLVRIILSGNNDTLFTYNGDQVQEGRTLSEFGFSVLPSTSRLTFRIAGRQITTPYDGVVLVDPITGDLVRIVIRMAEIAPSDGLCELTQRADYRKVRLEGKEFLLPAQVLTQLTKRDGIQFENRAMYSNWRGFSSPIAAAEHLASGSPAISAERAPPPGIRFSIALDQPINTATAMFGDRIQATVTSDDVDKKSARIAFPPGATVHGHILKLLRVYGKTESSYSLTILMRWETVTDDKGLRKFTARVDQGSRTVIGKFSGVDVDALKEADGFPVRIADYGLIEIPGLKPGHILGKRMRSIWKTAAP